MEANPSQSMFVFIGNYPRSPPPGFNGMYLDNRSKNDSKISFLTCFSTVLVPCCLRVQLLFQISQSFNAYHGHRPLHLRDEVRTTLVLNGELRLLAILDP